MPTYGQRDEIDLDELFRLVEAGSLVASGRSWNREAIWQAQWQYAQDGYAHELVENIVDYAVGSAPLVDFGDERLNEDFGRWRWNPLSAGDTPEELGRMIGISIVRDGDIFLERLQVDDYRELRLLPLDGRHIWSYGGQSSGEYLGVRLDDQMQPSAYLYRPSAVQPQEAEPRDWRDIPAELVIHHYRTEWPGQVRGESWIRRALPYLSVLQEFDRLLYRGMRRLVTNPGYWSYPPEYMLQDSSEDSIDPDDPDETGLLSEIYRRVLSETRWEDVDVEPRLPAAIEWRGKALTGISDGAVRSLRRALIERIARSVGISALTLSADSEGLNFLAARVTSQGDQAFYRVLQSLVRRAMEDVVEYWLDWATTRRPLWGGYQGPYRIDMPAFPYQDPLKDAAALDIQLRAGILSAQQAIRDSGRDPERVMSEILEWRERMGETEGGDGVTGPLTEEEMLDDAI